MAMNNLPGFNVEKPVSFWNKPLNADFRKLFASLGKAGAKGITQDWKGAASDMVDAATALGFKENLPQVAWTLIFRAASTALETLVLANQAFFESPMADPEILAERITSTLEECPVRLGLNFFKRPGSLPFLDELRRTFIIWLTEMGIDTRKAKEIANPLRSEFEVAVHNEWTSGSKEYEDLKKALLDNPFIDALQRIEAWRKHHNWLQERTEAHIFDEDFGIRAIYIPLRAYYEESPHASRGSDAKTMRRVVDLAEELQQWVDVAEPSDAIRYVSGEPGAGKSSFSNMFAADMSNRAGIPVLFVPLHDFPVDKADNLVDAMAQYIQTIPDLGHNPLDPKDGENSLLIVFDGLDELATSEGRYDENLANRFQHYLGFAVRNLNRSKPARVLVLVTGRELFIQRLGSQVIDDRKVLHILPYRIDTEPEADFEYDDPSHLLAEDQREIWWKYYSKAKDLEYHGVPEAMNKGELLKLTGQPLLNYLIAWMHVEGKTAFSETRNRNDIYRQIMDRIYERGWSDTPRHASLEGVSRKDFYAFLEAIAVGMWYGDGHQTTVARVRSLCDLDVFNNCVNFVREGGEQGITRLLIAFFFKYKDLGRDANRPFEFTHRSFGEYLTARHITNELDHLYNDLQGETVKTEALKRWASLCGPTPVDKYLLEFIRDEIALRDNDRPGTAHEWQEYVAVLIGQMLQEGMPMHHLDPRPDYPTEVRMARNAEEALLVVFNGCGRVSNVCVEADWPSDTSFGNWIARLRGQRHFSEFALLAGQFHAFELSVSLDCLAHLNLREQVLYGQELVAADLQSTNLSRTDLRSSILEEADLSRANLTGANLADADLSRANLAGANLADADLTGANLADADLTGANLTRAIFPYADLRETKLLLANLTEANLTGADLTAHNLSEANLRGASLTEASLTRANLLRAELVGADLSGTNLSESDLTWADLSEANLERTNFSGSVLTWADFKGANLREANLKGANIRGANLRNADLSGADLESADLSGADLRGAENLTLEQIKKTLGDIDTELPDGLTIKLRPKKGKDGSAGSETTNQ